ncbi:hypothetical protein MMC30_000633 [Trapelia coarctata]|nr:hypothetical protein [Trapelia coarctata]
MPSPFPQTLLSTIPSPLPTPSTLTYPSLSALLALYAPLLTHASSTKSRKGWKSVQELDVLRYETLPARVRERRSASFKDGKGKKGGDEGGEGWLEKGEVEDLMAWKLTRGKFRPTLLPLVKSNDAALITSTTRDAFALFASDPSDPFPALKKLAELRGVGPATSSLLLSVAFEEVPFFADEILGWLREGGGGKLKYDWKEYKEVWEGVKGVREGLDGGKGREQRASAVDVERGAWVVEMVKAMGLGLGTGEGEVRKKEEVGIVEEEGANVGAKEEDEEENGIREDNGGVQEEAKPIPSTKDTGKHTKRTSTCSSAHQKRKAPPSKISTPPARKKPKKLSKPSPTTAAGENHSQNPPLEPADPIEDYNPNPGRKYMQRPRPGDKAPRVPLVGPSCIWGAAQNMTVEVYNPRRVTRRRQDFWNVYTLG